MSMLIRWSIGRLYQIQPEIFDKIVLPEGIDKQLFIDTIMEEYGEMGIARPVNSMAQAIENWSRRNTECLHKLKKSLDIEYNPIENYDRFEEYTDNSTGYVTGSGEQQGHNTGINKTAVAAFDSEPVKENEIQNSENNGTVNTSTRTDTTGEHKHTAHVHGNVGVTTADQMLEDYRKTARFDWYAEAARMFASELLVGVYLF